MRAFRKIIPVSAVLALLASGARAETPAADQREDKTLGWSAEADFVQKYIWRGIDLQDNTPSIQPEIILDSIPSGVYFTAWGNLALDGDFREWDEADFYVGKYLSLLSERPYRMDFDLNYGYSYYYRQSRSEDTNELALSLKMPRVLKLPARLNLLPSFAGYYGWGHEGGKGTVWLKPGIKLTLTLPSPWPGAGEQTVSWFGTAWYGTGKPAYGLPEGWGSLETGLSAVLSWRGLSLSPAFHYQYVFHHYSPYLESEIWFTLSLAFEH
ncbi:MAG: hypothetical protein PHE84_10140 [bacterium]|nr:hypothetical protein [bacterium]